MRSSQKLLHLGQALMLSAALLAPTPARAQGQEIAEGLGLALLVVLDVAVGIGGTVTGIGSSVQLGRVEPSLGWSIASTAVGGVNILLGGLTLAAGFSGDHTEVSIVGGVLTGVGLWNVAVAITNFVRRGQAQAMLRGPSGSRFAIVPQIQPTRARDGTVHLRTGLALAFQL